MSNHHLTREQILAFMLGTPEDNDAVWAHIQQCDECWEVYEDLAKSDTLATVMRSALEHVDDDFDLDELWRGVEADADSEERDARAADALILQLAQHPYHEWMGIVGANPQACTAALVQGLIDAATPELDRNPDNALVLLNVAEMVAYTLDTKASLRSRGYVWKQRSNAYRMAARYDDSIDAAYVSEQLFAELREPDSNFEIGQARYAMAATLTKVDRFPAALRTLKGARELLEEYGESAPLAKVMMLEAVILMQQGDVRVARETLRELLPVEERLGQQLEVGRVRFNIAECNLRLGELDAAMDDAAGAIEIFRSLGNAAEQKRTEWTMVMIRIARGEEAARDLEPIASFYEQSGMPGEAGFVTLDLTEYLLKNEEWAKAEFLARGLVNLFIAAGVTLASVNALHFLRTAVENREATTETVRYIRTYVSADDPERPFEPPILRPN
jgi:tetratricopeptide (TPR) repeat protein